MKKHYLLGMTFLLITIFSSFAQQVPREKIVSCYFDELLSKQLQEDPALRKKLDEMDREIERFKTAKKKGGGAVSKSLSDKLLIPVVVHVVHQNGPENISDMQVISQINALNTYYEDYGIQFCLATKKGTINLTSISTPAGITSSTPGIFHYYNPTLTNHDVSQINALAAVGASLPADNYLRIWVVKGITSASVPPGSIIQGYSSLPGSYNYTDGIVMDYRAFGDIATCGCSTLASYSQLGRIAVHEVGHYLGLYHTFQDGCAGMNASTCASQGDRVCDTPPVATPGNTGCPAPGWNTCNETPNLPDDIHNYMDYVDEGCMTGFTNGQNDRMDASIALYRANLVSSNNMVYTGINCNGQIMAHFTADNYAPCTGTSVTFTANPVSGATYSWDFGDGSTGSGQVVSHTYTAAYAPAIVTLTVTSGSNLSDFAENEELVFPTNCTAISNTQSIWMFSNQAGLDFSSGAPVYDNSADINNTMTGNAEDVVSQCDASGNLLFYSNGDNIWDQNHSLIASALNADNSSATGSIAIPNPANSSQYLQFNTSFNQGGLLYSVISITGTQASIVSNNNPVPVPAGYIQSGATLWSGEGVTAVKACNYYWLIVHGKKSEYQHFLMVYKVSASGIAFHSEYALNSFDGIYCTIEASPDGTKILVSEFVGNSMFLCDFNPVSGFITGDEIINRERVYGTSFSPDSKLFYAVQETTGDLFQYDVTASNVFLSEVKVGNVIAPYPVKRLGMQCGPDNKIYISRNMTQLGAIHAPNTQSTISQPNLCLFTNNGPYLDVLAAGSGLPNMVDADQVQLFTGDSIFAEEVRCDTYTFSSNICANSYSWNFGDPASGSSNTASGASPTHIFSGPGTYNIVVSGNGITLNYTIVVAQGCEPCVCPENGSFSYSIVEEECYVKFHANYVADPCLENVEYTWDFGDGTTATGIDVDHAFATAGTHTICLTITALNDSELCTIQGCKTIETRCTPPCDCKLRPGFNVSFDDKECIYTFEGFHGGPECLKYVEYYWDFGDGTTSIGQITGHVFPASGSYDVCVTAVIRNEKGDVLCTERYCEKIKARCGGRCDCKLKPGFDMVNSGDCNMLFTGFSGSNCANITQMEWTVNGAGPYYGQYLVQQFQVNTPYEICLTVTGNNGDVECKETYCQEYFYTDCYPAHGKSLVTTPTAPQWQLYPNPASKSVQLKVSFRPESSTIVTLKTADGKLIGRYTFDKEEQEMSLDIPQSVSSGFVFVEIQSGDYFFTEKLMIMH
jgi:hypothetical protein